MSIRILLASGLALISLAGCDGSTPPNDRGPAGILKIDGDQQVAAVGSVLPESLVVRVINADNGGVGGVTVTWSVTSGGGSIAPVTAVTDGSGRAATRWTIGALGTNTVLASAGGFSTTFAAIATGGPPPVNHVAITTQPSDGLSGIALPTQPVLQLRNAQGGAVAQAGVVITATVASGNQFATLGGGTNATTNASGQAAFANLRITGPVGNYTLQFAAAGFTAATSAVLDLSTQSGLVPLTDMGSRTYQGFTGGLYANGSNTMPAAHAAAGAARARNVVPRGTGGAPSAGGKVVLMSIGMSNTTQEWCDSLGGPCSSWSFSGQAAADNAVDHQELVVVNGAKRSQTAQDWASAASPNYDRVRDSVLAPLGLTEAQVQVIWLKVVNPDPSVSLPSANADAVRLLEAVGDILRTLHGRYPNLQIVFLSSRSYGGYANIPLNPEPYAYETGFGIKWLIQAQIDQMANGGTIVDNRAGNLNYNTVAPWIAWGPYFWADGLNPRSDGLTWAAADFESDGTHPSTSGETKVGAQLLTFFKTDPRAACWFLAGATCP